MAKKRPSEIIDLIKTHNVRLHELQKTKAQIELSTDNTNFEIEIRNIDLEIEEIQAEIAKLKKEQRQNDLNTLVVVFGGIFLLILLCCIIPYFLTADGTSCPYPFFLLGC